MNDHSERDSPIQTGSEELHGTTVADDRHVGDAEAKAALNTDEAEERLPPDDLEFEEDEEDLG